MNGQPWNVQNLTIEHTDEEYDDCNFENGIDNIDRGDSEAVAVNCGEDINAGQMYDYSFVIEYDDGETGQTHGDTVTLSGTG